MNNPHVKRPENVVTINIICILLAILRKYQVHFKIRFKHLPLHPQYSGPVYHRIILEPFLRLFDSLQVLGIILHVAAITVKEYTWF